MRYIEAPTKTPVPTKQPTIEPVRRLEPERICPHQQTEITRRIKRVVEE